MNQLKAAMLPLDIVRSNPAANLAAVEAAAASLLPDTDLLALPELFTTGFIIDSDCANALAEPLDGPTMVTLRRIATTRRVAVSGSFLCRADDGTLRNRAFFINPDDGIDIFYDKHHLFVLSDEKRIFRAGDELPPVALFRGWRIALTVCYDLRFPLWLRNTPLRYDMMIVPANWPDSRAYAWRTLLAARAIENQAVYLGVDCSGSNDYGTYSPELTLAADALGMTRLDGDTDPVSPLRYATFSLDEVATLRRRFPVHLSADGFTIS